MIIHDLHVVSVAIFEGETNTVLVVDSYTVLTSPVLLQLFEPISGRHPQIIQTRCRIEQRQLTFRYLPQIRRRHSLTLPRIPELLRALVREGLNHMKSVTDIVNNVKR